MYLMAYKGFLIIKAKKRTFMMNVLFLTPILSVRLKFILAAACGKEFIGYLNYSFTYFH